MQHSSKMDCDVLVIGGGASGMMAAIRAAELGKKVILLEKNKHLGKKLAITGGGRCNITNAEFDTRKLLAHFGKSSKFLHSAFSRFGVEDTFTFFENRRLPLVVQARNRVFPETENAPDVVRVLEHGLKENHVEIKTEVSVSRLLSQDGAITGVETNHGVFQARSIVIATGGAARAEANTSDGFQWLEALAHTVARPTPDIVPLAVSENWVKELAGTSLSFMKISFYADKKRKFSKTGKLLFTHFGISGPLILNSAREVKNLLEEAHVSATIDLFPDTDLGTLETRVLATFDQNKNKTLKNILPELAPASMTNALLELVELKSDRRVHSITADERKKLVHVLKALPLTIEGLMGFDRAVIADGGVALEEVDMRTLRSKYYDNLYLTGDILHINRPSGGYSLQLCWTTGWIAGENA